MVSGKADENSRASSEGTSLETLMYAPSLTSWPLVEDISDPFLDRDLLQESELVQVRQDATLGIASLLLDMRGALQFDHGDWALIVGCGLASVEVNQESVTPSPHARIVVASRVDPSKQQLVLNIDTWPDGNVRITATGLFFFLLDCSSMRLERPDYGLADRETIRLSRPAWDSPWVHVIGMSSLVIE